MGNLLLEPNLFSSANIMFALCSCSRYSSSQSESEAKERRHSHTIMSMTEAESPPQLPSPTHLSQSFTGKTPPTNVGEYDYINSHNI